MREKLKTALVILETVAGIIIIAAPTIREIASRLDACKESVQLLSEQC